ncbi:MAG: ABC transporter permease [Planctomycetes bacterium]|nr:ABC transporter permease [Planctomycetota bacterium]
MNRARFVRRSIWFYRRTHLGVAVGCALSTAVLVGALGVGDSVRASLERVARARLGRVDSALDRGNRTVRDDLADRLCRALDADVAAILRVPGMAIREMEGDGGRKQVNRVEVLGVDGNFFKLAESPLTFDLGPKDLAVNEKLAAALGANIGDEVALRIFMPALLSRDAPLVSKRDRQTQRRLFTLRAVLSDSRMGRFSLKSDQTAPYNAFVDLRGLQKTLEMEGLANLIVSGQPAPAALESAWRLEDAELDVRAFAAHGIVQLQSSRIYLDPSVSERALTLQGESAGALTYLVNSIASESGRSTPYSFMTAISPSAGGRLGPVPSDMKDDEILVNRWLADHLSIREGDRVRIAYSELTPSNAFIERSRWFVVRGVLEMETLEREKDLIPEFPGLTDVESCKDWDLGLPMEERKLKDEANEEYWNTYRQTPKAFVTLAAGREMWANRFGDLMAVRFPSSAREIREAIRARLEPAEVGLVFQPVRADAMKAVSESTDLGQLFLGMSAFLIAASLTLTALLFMFAVEQRARERGVLLAVGYTPGRVKRLLLAEGAILATLGSLAGVPFGWGLAAFLIWGLSAAWSGAVAGASVDFQLDLGTALIGAAAAAGMSLLTMGVAIWRQERRSIWELISEDFPAEAARFGSKKPWIAWTVFAAAGGGAAAIVVAAIGAEQPAAAFFAAGALLLIGGISLFRVVLARMSGAFSNRLSAAVLGVRNAARRPGRSLAAAGMLACGCFAVFAVSAMKEDLSLEAGKRASGTGGFELYGESSIAVHHELNEESGVSIVPVKLREGDDASCLNLNFSRTPPLLGVDAAELARLGAFAGRELWDLLEEERANGVVPAIVGDSATAVWKLKKKVSRENGDLLDYTDERGRQFQVKLVGALPMRLSVFQGKLLISNKEFTRLYPSESGYRVFLVDAPEGNEDRLIAYLSEKLETVGLNLERSVERLKEFYVVESTYLAMFMVLGGLGLLLGGAGMGVLVLRSVMERRGELALLWAVGYAKGRARDVVAAEHRFLLIAGIAAGTAAAAVAIVPAAARPGTRLPYGLLALFLIGIGAVSLAWIWLAARLALRGPLLPALRNE